MNVFDNTISVQSVYIHWPFCPYKCHFCPFVALAGQDEFMHAYHEALLTEIRHYAQRNMRRQRLDTIYFGGGTPSTYPLPMLRALFQELHQHFDIMYDTEITVEVNPGTVHQSLLTDWKELGINRLSIGVQSLKDTVLQKLNRLQTVEQVHQVLQYAQEIFHNVSIDLIIGLPEVSSAEWKSMLKTIIEWPIAHMSIYFLTVHENTPLYFGIKKNSITLPAEDEIVDLYYWSVDLLARAGFEQYEISNFARNGNYSRHNKVYWDRKPYYAFGLGACSFDGQHRFQNEKNLKKYMDRVRAGQDAVVYSERLTLEQERLEVAMLSLRQKSGISCARLYSLCSAEKRERLPGIIAELVQNGLLIQEEDHIRLTPEGLAVQNSIVIALSD